MALPPRKRAKVMDNLQDLMALPPRKRAKFMGNLQDLMAPPPRKRAKVMDNLQDLMAFPAMAEGFEGPFRNNVQHLISSQGLNLPSTVPQLQSWRISVNIDEEVQLDILEEDVEESRTVYCDTCRILGWIGNPVCRKRYHFIIRNKESPVYRQDCAHCGTVQHWLYFQYWHKYEKINAPCLAARQGKNSMTVEHNRKQKLRILRKKKCTSCGVEQTTSAEDWAYLQLEDTYHLLHGVVHSNGYGHLLRINGREGGSRSITGYKLVEFWDRLCKLLHVRKVSVMDVSKKHGMEYRLLHGVMKGHSWYGNWGYEFGIGGFAVTLADYEKATYTLSNIPLSVFHNPAAPSQLWKMISRYLCLSNFRLKTVRDLFCFMTDLHQENIFSAISNSCMILFSTQSPCNPITTQSLCSSPQQIPFSVVMWCQLELIDAKEYVNPPPELIVLPTTATVADLKLEATKSFQETYLDFEGFQVKQVLVNSEVINDAIQINSAVCSNDSATVRGRCLINQGMFEQFRTEKGNEDGIVDCTCGLKDDDGERMLACDNCGVWQHTRCTGIQDFELVPEKFIFIAEDPSIIS